MGHRLITQIHTLESLQRKGKGSHKDDDESEVAFRGRGKID